MTNIGLPKKLPKLVPQKKGFKHSWKKELGYDYCKICGLGRKVTGKNKNIPLYLYSKDKENWSQGKTSAGKCINPKQERLFPVEDINDNPLPINTGRQKVTTLVEPIVQPIDKIYKNPWFDLDWLDHQISLESPEPFQPGPFAPSGTLLPVTVGYRPVHVSANRKDTPGDCKSLVTFKLIDRRNRIEKLDLFEYWSVKRKPPFKI